MSKSSQSYPMSGGDDQHSYIHNSSYQKTGIDGVKEMTRQYILDKFDLQNVNPDLISTFAIADFGCSIGPNTFHAVQNIIDTVKLKHLRETQGDSAVPLEFQVYFNDQSNNDFNTLFKTLHPFEQEYFAVGVPGSFYGRVLPRNSIHIGLTSYTTHWLSKVPENVCDKKSPAWNKYYIQCNNLIEEVTKAYRIQFTKDMSVFLKARAEELVSGGLMIVLGQCLPDGVPINETWPGIVKETVGDCLLDMATLGVTSHKKIGSFSLPMHFPEFSELKGEIEQNESFTIEMIETVSYPLKAMQLTSDFMTSMYRAILSSVIQNHFGDGVVDEVFDRLAKKLSKNPIDFEKCKKQIVYYIVLKRK